MFLNTCWSWSRSHTYSVQVRKKTFVDCKKIEIFAQMFFIFIQNIQQRQTSYLW